MLTKYCEVHQRDFKWYGNRQRCSKCYSETVVASRRRKSKQLKTERGGQCEQCSYNRCLEALEWHHKEENKEFTIAQKLDWSIERLRKETDKCELLCANCHRERHWSVV